MPLDRRTRATLRRAEFGFFGVVVYTRVQTPRRWGAPFSAGVLPLAGLEARPFLTSCWMVGTRWPFGTHRPMRRSPTPYRGEARVEAALRAEPRYVTPLGSWTQDG